MTTLNLERMDPCNWSSLKWLRVSPKHYLHNLSVPRPQTDAMLLGSVAHCAILQPETLAQVYAVEPNFHGGMLDVNARAKGYDGGKEAKAAWALANCDRQTVPADIYERALAMRDAVLSDPLAADLLRGGVPERRIEWADVVTGIACRGTPDYAGTRLVEIKTVSEIDPDKIRRDIARLGHAAQVAFYADGLSACGFAPDGMPVLIAVESVAPFDVLTLEFTDRDLAAGRAMYRGCLDRLAECRFLGSWPGVSGGERQYVDLPKWATPSDDPEQVESPI
jgi:hypothetical protein